MYIYNVKIINNIIYMSNLTFNQLKISDILNKESNTFIRTPEPSEPLRVGFNVYIS